MEIIYYGDRRWNGDDDDVNENEKIMMDNEFSLS